MTEEQLITTTEGIKTLIKLIMVNDFDIHKTEIQLRAQGAWDNVVSPELIRGAKELMKISIEKCMTLIP